MKSATDKNLKNYPRFCLLILVFGLGFFATTKLAHAASISATNCNALPGATCSTTITGETSGYGPNDWLFAVYATDVGYIRTEIPAGASSLGGTLTHSLTSSQSVTFVLVAYPILENEFSANRIDTDSATASASVPPAPTASLSGSTCTLSIGATTCSTNINYTLNNPNGWNVWIWDDAGDSWANTTISSGGSEVATIKASPGTNIAIYYWDGNAMGVGTKHDLAGMNLTATQATTNPVIDVFNGNGLPGCSSASACDGGVAFPGTFTAGVSNTYSISAHNADGKTYSYIFNWGDGQSTAPISAGSCTTQPCTLIQQPHTYASPGPYQLTVTAVSIAGGSFSDSVSATISTQAPIPVLDLSNGQRDFILNVPGPGWTITGAQKNSAIEWNNSVPSADSDPNLPVAQFNGWFLSGQTTDATNGSYQQCPAGFICPNLSPVSGHWQQKARVPSGAAGAESNTVDFRGWPMSLSIISRINTYENNQPVVKDFGPAITVSPSFDTPGTGFLSEVTTPFTASFAYPLGNYTVSYKFTTGSQQCNTVLSYPDAALTRVTDLSGNSLGGSPCGGSLTSSQITGTYNRRPTFVFNANDTRIHVVATLNGSPWPSGSSLPASYEIDHPIPGTTLTSITTDNNPDKRIAGGTGGILPYNINYTFSYPTGVQTGPSGPVKLQSISCSTTTNPCTGGQNGSAAVGPMNAGDEMTTTFNFVTATGPKIAISPIVSTIFYPQGLVTVANPAASFNNNFIIWNQGGANSTMDYHGSKIDPNASFGFRGPTGKYAAATPSRYASDNLLFNMGRFLVKEALARLFALSGNAAGGTGVLAFVSGGPQLTANSTGNVTADEIKTKFVIGNNNIGVINETCTSTGCATPLNATLTIMYFVSLPTVQITANGTAGSITVAPGTQVTISWTSTNANTTAPNPCNTCFSGTGFDPQGQANGSQTITVNANTTFSIKIKGLSDTDTSAANFATDQVAVNMSGGCTGSPTLTVSPSSATISANGTRQFTASFDSDGPSCPNPPTDVTAFGSTSWASSNTAVATVNNVASKGLATAVSSGNTTVTATNGGLSNSASLTVSAPVATLIISPPSASITNGSTQQFTASFDPDGSGPQQAVDVTNDSAISWTSSNTSFATVSNVSPNKGLATGVGVGTAQIGATFNSVSATAASLTVSGSAAISVSCSNGCTFSAIQGGANPAPQTLTISNTGSATLNWAISKDAFWLTPGAISGSTPAAGASSVSLTANTAGLTAGIYRATITISGNGNTVSQSVKLNVANVGGPKPIFDFSPSSTVNQGQDINFINNSTP